MQAHEHAHDAGGASAGAEHLDSRLRGNDGAEIAGTTKADGAPALPGAAPREVGYRRMNTRFRGAVEHGGPPSPNRLVGSRE